jgi:hypothetical protein
MTTKADEDAILLAMATAARPISDDDYGSKRQIEAEEIFHSEVRDRLTLEQYDALVEQTYKATTDEAIDLALKACGVKA